MDTYYESVPVGKRKAKAIFAGNNPHKIIRALIGITFHDPDYEWIQSRCLEFCEHSDNDVRATAIICLGHIARIHSKIDKKAILVLKKLQSDSSVGGVAKDALADIKRFAKK